MEENYIYDKNTKALLPFVREQRRCVSNSAFNESIQPLVKNRVLILPFKVMKRVRILFDYLQTLQNVRRNYAE